MATGPRGEQGIQGVRGDQGIQGPTGLQGPQGLQGQQGFQGLPGAATNTGATGPTGYIGRDGSTGATGPGTTSFTDTLSSLTASPGDAPLLANAVSVGSSSPTIVASWTIPSRVKGKQVLLCVFFYFYQTSAFATGQTFRYGFQIDSSEITYGDSTTVFYTQTAQNLYAVAYNGLTLGTGGILPVEPLIFPVTIPSNSTNLSLAVRNASIIMPITDTQVLGTATTFSYTGAAQSYTVPAGINAVYLYMWGAGGGAGSGGPGAFVSGTYNVSPGQVLTVVVGKRGSLDGKNAPVIALGAGGAASSNGGLTHGGGGFSGVFNSSTLNFSTLIACAAGGGSGGYFGGQGGAGGVTTGQSANGTGATQSAGGVANGALLTGGTATGSESAGGGGGYYGGGGGTSQYGPGGGGSSYIGGFSSYIGGEDGQFSAPGTTRIPGGSTNQYYVSPRGQTNQDGQVTIVTAVINAPVRVNARVQIISF